jgi:hypothetical protein
MLVGLALDVAAIGCLVVAFSKRHDVTFEGAYFNRAGGQGVSVAGVHHAVTPWIIAAAVLVALGATVFVGDGLRRRSSRR